MSESSVPLPATKSYKWGRFQGVVIFCIGLVEFIPAPFLKGATAAVFLLHGAYLLVLGWGLIGKRKISLAMFYIQILLTYALGYLAPEQVNAARWAFIAFLVVPGAFYYPKRWSEFR